MAHGVKNERKIPWQNPMAKSKKTVVFYIVLKTSALINNKPIRLLSNDMLTL